MWVFTETGFVSAVQHYKNPDALCVRARDGESLSPLAKITGKVIEHSPERDYPYRLEGVSKSDFILLLMQSIDVLEYTNFKNQVHATRGTEYASALGKVWSAMHDVEDFEARRYIQ